MFFVGLDLSLRSTGFCALSESGEVLRLVSFGASLDRGATNDQKVSRLAVLAKRILSEIESVSGHGSPEVCIENYAFGARGAQNDLGELHGCVKLQLYLAFDKAPLTVSASTYRKSLIGSGRTSKDGSFLFAKRVLTDRSTVITNTDEADAFLVAEWFRLFGGK